MVERYNQNIQESTNDLLRITDVEYGTAVAGGYVPNLQTFEKFGRNPDVDTTTDPEDVWNGGGLYTGFDATENEELRLTSADANDVGTVVTVVTNGTATGGSATTLEATDDTFSTDGVAVGDIVVNDTRGSHGVISVVAETQLTVHRMWGDTTASRQFLSGDTYRVVTSGGTGAGLVRVEQILNKDYAEQTPVYIVPNGLSNVDTSGVTAMRASRARVLLAGSGGTAAGDLTIRQATTTANIMAVMPATFNRTLIAAWTVPAGKELLVKNLRTSIALSGAANGYATMSFMVRRRGEVFQAERVFELHGGPGADDKAYGAIIIPAQSDVKWQCTEASANNTIAEGVFEGLLRNE